MAKIQNPQNQRGETLATEQNVKTSFENLSNSINDIKYFISTLENDTLPASINLELNVNTDLKASEPSEDQIVSAPAAKNYVDHELDTVVKTKTESLPSIYTGDNKFYVNCYGFEYTNPSENIIFDKIEIKFAKNLNTLTKFKPGNAPEISPLEIENNICKIVVAKVKTPPPGVYEQPPASDEIEIATSNYNTGVSKEDNLKAYPSQFKFSENILLEEGWNYRFYFYDKNDNLFPASVIVNFIPDGDTTLKQSSVANRYLSERYDYWGVHGVKQDNNTKVLNGLGIKLINSVQEHANNKDIHVTLDDKNNWNSWENAISEEKYTITEYDKISGDYTTFVLPYNIVPAGSSINTVKLEITKGSPGASAYLGAGLLFTDGSIKLLKVSNNAESISSRGILTWYFDEALELKENSRFVFYLLKNKEDFISPHPLVSSDVRICSRAARVVPGSDYSSWDNVISNLNYGFISNAANLEAGNYNSMWDEYPVCTLSKIHHVNNDIRHFKEGEHEQLFSDEKLIFDSEKNVLSTNTGQYYGIRYIPSETFKFNKISIVRDPNASAIGSKYLFIFKEEDNTKVFVQKCSTRPGTTIVDNICSWEFEPTLLEKNGKYFIIFRDNESEIYSKSFVRLQALKQNSASESLYFINNNDQETSTSYVPNIKIYGEGRLFATIDELNAHVDNFNNHVGNSTHITDAERTKWDSALYTITGSDYINISTDGSKTISVTNIAESISDNTSDLLVTEGSIIKYADDTKDENGEIIEQGLLTRWHIENEYFHMQKSVADSLKSFNLDNYGVGDICKGVIMKLPYLSKIKSISLVAVTASEYNQPLPEKAMTWSNYRLKIVDTLSGQVLATSEIGKNANSAANDATKGYPIGLFDFVNSNTDINQIYCDAQREYQILFVNEAGETVNIHLAYANGNGSYATYENYTFGELSPKVILPDGTIKEHPLSFSVAGQAAVDCKGYACDFAVDTVKSEELTHLSKQIGELKNYIAYMNAYINQLNN